MPAERKQLPADASNSSCSILRFTNSHSKTLSESIPHAADRACASMRKPPSSRQRNSWPWVWEGLYPTDTNKDRGERSLWGWRGNRVLGVWITSMDAERAQSSEKCCSWEWEKLKHKTVLIQWKIKDCTPRPAAWPLRRQGSQIYIRVGGANWARTPLLGCHIFGFAVCMQ